MGDRNYWSPERQEELKEHWGVKLLAPSKRHGRDEKVGWTRWLTQKRRWHLLTRIYREVLSHTVAVYLNVQRGGEPLRFDKLLAH